MFNPVLTSLNEPIPYKKNINLLFFTFILAIILAFILAFILPSCSSENSDNRIWDETIPEFIQTSGETYYLSNNGDDSSSGLSEAEAWETLDRLNQNLSLFQPGDTILFRAGDRFRGHLEPMVGEEGNWIKYSSYGTGDNPQIIGSLNLKDITQWKEIDSSNVWQAVEDISDDVGGLFFDSVDSKGYYGEYGLRVWSIAELTEDKEFYYDPTGSDKKLYLHSSTGNPGALYSDIEASLNVHLVEISQREYILFEGLSFNKGAGHGFSGDHSQYLIIRACDFSYLGGGFLYNDGTRDIRYGNGIEFWASANNNLVYGNRFWEIYDTAVTNQGHSTTSSQRYLYYFNNIIWNCGLASFELWNRPSKSEMGNIYFINNTSINPGHGWGGSANREDKNSFHIASYYNSSSGDSLVIKNNIFYTSETPPAAENHLFFFDEDVNGVSYSKYIIDHNLWNMPSPKWAITTDTVYNTFLSWQLINNQSRNGIIADPLFTDFLNDDFTLSINSPAIDAGDFLFRNEDFYGNPNTGAPDLGAIEY